jgi:hypothetical protein
MPRIQGQTDLITLVSGKLDTLAIMSGNDSKVNAVQGSLSTVITGQMSPYVLVSGHASWTPNLQGSLTGQVLTTAVKSSALYKKVYCSSGDIYTSNYLISASNDGRA